MGGSQRDVQVRSRTAQSMLCFTRLCEQHGLIRDLAPATGPGSVGFGVFLAAALIQAMAAIMFYAGRGRRPAPADAQQIGRKELA